MSKKFTIAILLAGLIVFNYAQAKEGKNPQ
jgi:hypothetical protein